MSKKSIQILQYLVLLAIGILLCRSFFKSLDIAELKQNISSGNFTWFYVVMFVSVMVYIIRVLRWQMLIKAIGYEAKFSNAFAALSISYFVSFVVPRLGEVTRCLSIKKQHDIPFMELLGTVIIERAIDIVSLLIVLLLTLALQFSMIMEFVKQNIITPFYDGVIVKIIAGNSKILIVVLSLLFIVIALFLYFRKYIREKSPRLVLQFVDGLKHGLVSIVELKQKRLFILYTFLIWVCYYLMTYFWFFVFKETSILGLGACLSILSIGTIGRSVPIQGGGMGAYHFLVTNVAIIYGVSASFGKTLATLIHAGQTFFTFALGLIGLLIFFVSYWRNK